MKNIVLNIPHSSTLRGSEGWTGDIIREIERWTDIGTEKIFKSKTNNCTAVVFPYSRFFCDAERLVNDDLEKVGQGIYYTSFNGCHRYESLKQEAYACYVEHQRRLQSQINEETLIIDCHSFPSDLFDIDICIGYNEDWSKPDRDFLTNMKMYFEGYGYSVSFNKPYSNSITPEMPFYYKSVMIELNKGIYTHQDGSMVDYLYKINMMLNNMYEKILTEWKY